MTESLLRPQTAEVGSFPLVENTHMNDKYHPYVRIDYHLSRVVYDLTGSADALTPDARFRLVEYARAYCAANGFPRGRTCVDIGERYGFVQVRPEHAQEIAAIFSCFLADPQNCKYCAGRSRRRGRAAIPTYRVASDQIRRKLAFLYPGWLAAPLDHIPVTV